MNPVSGTMHERDHRLVPWYINPNHSSPCAQLLCTAERSNFPRAWWTRNKSFIHATATSLSVCSFQLLLVTPALTSRNKQRWNQNKIFIRSAAVGSSARKTRVSRLRNCISGLCIKEKKRFDANLLPATARGIHNTGAQCRSHSEKESALLPSIQMVVALLQHNDLGEII